jgi:hypothetical protein
MRLEATLQLGALLLVVSLIAALGVQTKRAERYQALDVRHKACVAAIKSGPEGAPAAAGVCDLAIASVNAVALRSTACDQALDAKPLNLYGARASCSAPVKQLQADRDAQAANVADLKLQLATERNGRAAAISRAQAAATTEAERKARAAAAVKAAPRDGAGLLVCDAQCMRDRWGQADAVARP